MNQDNHISKDEYVSTHSPGFGKGNQKVWDGDHIPPWSANAELSNDDMNIMQDEYLKGDIYEIPLRYPLEAK
jgi:hypothetical protein